jgi:putative transposase
MTALVRRTLPAASRGAVGRAMRAMVLYGDGRAKGVRTTTSGKDAQRSDEA